MDVECDNWSYQLCCAGVNNLMTVLLLLTHELK